MHNPNDNRQAMRWYHNFSSIQVYIKSKKSRGHKIRALFPQPRSTCPASHPRPSSRRWCVQTAPSRLRLRPRTPGTRPTQHGRSGVVPFRPHDCSRSPPAVAAPHRPELARPSTGYRSRSRHSVGPPSAYPMCRPHVDRAVCRREHWRRPWQTS